MQKKGKQFCPNYTSGRSNVMYDDKFIPITKQYMNKQDM